MGIVGIVVRKIKVLGDDGDSVVFEYRDGIMSGVYTTRRQDPLHNTYRNDGMLMPTSKSQHMVDDLLKEHVLV